MSWDFTADDLRKELKELKEKLAVQGVKVGEQESKILKNEEELKTTKEGYAEAMYKLRKEADRTLELEEALKRRNDELRNEKNTRENIEKALRTANDERDKEATSVKEAQYFLNQVASNSNEYLEQREKLAAEKVKLEAQVRELQGELRRHQTAPPPPPKTPARPRASSLTNMNKVALLERDMEQIRASASASEMDLKSTQEKLSRAQSDLLRIENEKAAIEKKLKDNERRIKDILEDKDDLQTELDFYRKQNASGSREEELMARLEEEENRAALLEQQLAQASCSNGVKRSVDQLQARLNNEVSRREAVEARETELVQEREEALNDLDNFRMTLQGLNVSISQKDARISELEAQERALQEQLEAARNNAASSSVGIDEGKISEMVNGIARIRAERDELKAHLEFVQMEAHFKVEALEKKLAEQTASTLDEAQLQEYRTLTTHLTSKLNVGKLYTQKLHTTMSAMFVTVQHLHAQNGCLREQVFAIASSQELAVSRGDNELAALRNHLNEQIAERSSLGSIATSLQEDLRIKSEESDRAAAEHHAILASKDEEIAEFHLRLSDTTLALREEKGMRSALEDRVRELEVNLITAKQQLADALEHCERLEVRQSLESSSDVATRTLKNEIEELRSRVMRRTEQIGLQQHDIKRLETNMRLTDERLEEVLGELEMAETAKAAMLEDCSTAREERDQAKKALVQAELELERLSALVREAQEETCKLKATLLSAGEREKETGAMKDGELAALTNAIAERDSRIDSLLDSLRSVEAALRDARGQAVDLRKELETVQESTKQTVEELQEQARSDKLVASEEYGRRVSELRSLTQELEDSKLAHTDAKAALQTKAEEYERALGEIEHLASNLEAAKMAGQEDADVRQPKDEEMECFAANARRLASELEDAKTAHQETRTALLAREEQLQQKMEELHQSSIELESIKVNQEESARMLQSKEKELGMNSAELKHLAFELENKDAKQQEIAATLQAKEDQLVRASERVARLETEKADLLTRLAAFEDDSEQGLTNLASLRSVLEEERRSHEQEVRKLEADIASLQAGMEEQLKASDSISKDLKARQEETAALLKVTKVELEEKQALCDALADEQRRASACREDEAVNLKERLASLSSEMEGLQRTLQEEVDGRKREFAAHEEELQAALDKQESSSAAESELRHNVRQYQDQLAEVRSNLMALQDENTNVQSEMDNLSGECRRTNLKSQSLERQLASNGKELSGLRDEMSRVREALSQSEKSGKTAEMNLLLISQQHERTISSLRNQLKEHEKDAERIQKLQQIVGETREQIGEMEGLLRAKCAEIEDNDDKFIQLLKEKKKLTSKVESLTKKNNNLQNKLSAASAGPSKVASPPSRESTHQNFPTEPVQCAPIFAVPEAPAPSSSKLRLSSRPAPSQSKTPEQPRRSSGTKRRRESTPPLDEILVTTTIGKKRPLPDDSDSGRASVEARFPDSYQPAASGSSTPPMPSSSTSHMPSVPSMSEFTSTPRQRRPLQTLRTGFTPVRGQTALRPTLSQPSPVRRSAVAQALQNATVISDITNSPPRAKRVFTAEPGSTEPRTQKPAGKGWLGKIRGGGTNPLLRTRQQPNPEGNP